MNQVFAMTYVPGPTGKSHRRSAPARSRIVAQLWRMAEKQVEQVEARLEALHDEPQALERDAKTLGIIARTVRELIAIEEEKTRSRNGGKGDAAGRAEAERTIEDFRRELEEKLEQLRPGGQRGGTPPDAFSGGD